MILIKADSLPIPVLTRDHEPTEGQIKAGNYRKPKRRFAGLDVSIENPAGSYRRGQDRAGKTWETRMLYDYGYIRGTLGVDGDHVDCYLGPNEDAPMAYIVHQRRYGDWEKFDEDKCMLGFDSQEDAVAAYLKHYDDPRFLGPVTAMPMDEFRAKVLATKEAPQMIKAIPLILKAHVKQHTRTLQSGKVVVVREHDDKRQAAKKDVPVTETPEFKRWFGDSKAVDDQGRPLVVYHGSSEPLEIIQPGYDEPGAWFTTSRQTAGSYAKGERGTVHSVYLSVKKPLIADFTEWANNGGDGPIEIDGEEFEDNVSIVKYAERHGYDGVHFTMGNFTEDDETWVVFEPEQIKSTDNRGTFDPDSPNILKAHVKQHTRRVGGKMIVVRAHDDKRIKRPDAGSGEKQMDMFAAADEHGEMPPAKVLITRRPGESRPSKDEAMREFVADAAKPAKTGRMTYAQAVAANMKHMGTKEDEWSAVEVDGFSEVDAGGGERRSMPTFNFPTGYAKAPSLFAGEGCCNLCGTEIKNYYWLKHDKNRWIMPVGSECVTHYNEGVSGEKMAKKTKAEENRSLLRDFVDARRRLWSAFSRRVPLGYGRYETVIHVPDVRALYEKMGRVKGTMLADGKHASNDGAVTRWVNKHKDAVSEMIKQSSDLIDRWNIEQSMRVSQSQAPEETPAELQRFYVTMVREPGPRQKVAWLAGPFNSKEEADSHVEAASAKAREVDPWADFDVFGVTGRTATTHPPGVLNQHLGLPG